MNLLFTHHPLSAHVETSNIRDKNIDVIQSDMNIGFFFRFLVNA